MSSVGIPFTTDSPLDRDSVCLLWTGGWESTFQLLQLLIVGGCRVTPFYLIDADRRSTGAELLTMKRIKERLFRDYPQTQDLLGPSRYFAVADLSPDPEITEAFRAVLNEHYLGSQYEWLSRFCKQNALDSVQLCAEKDTNPHEIVKKMLLETGEGPERVARVDPAFSSTDEYALLRYFTFPLLHLSKKDAGVIADKQGLSRIMAMTWFCHTPRSNMRPCGKCTPCTITREDGLGYRIPVSSRMLAAFDRSVTVPSKEVAREVARSMLSRLGLLAYAREKRQSHRERQ